MEVRTGILEQVDGSAVWTQNITKVICSVSGPMEVKPRDEIPDKATLELVVRPVSGLSSMFEIFFNKREGEVTNWFRYT
jgi:exosome complex component RRP46